MNTDVDDYIHIDVIPLSFVGNFIERCKSYELKLLFQQNKSTIVTKPNVIDSPNSERSQYLMLNTPWTKTFKGNDSDNNWKDNAAVPSNIGLIIHSFLLHIANSDNKPLKTNSEWMWLYTTSA